VSFVGEISNKFGFSLFLVDAGSANHSIMPSDARKVNFCTVAGAWEELEGFGSAV
jgi:hypothetical protein